MTEPADDPELRGILTAFSDGLRRGNDDPEFARVLAGERAGTLTDAEQAALAEFRAVMAEAKEVLVRILFEDDQGAGVRRAMATASPEGRA